MYPELRTTVAIEDVRRKGFLWTGGVKQDNTGVEVPLGEKTMWAEESCTWLDHVYYTLGQRKELLSYDQDKVQCDIQTPGPGDSVYAGLGFNGLGRSPSFPSW